MEMRCEKFYFEFAPHFAACHHRVSSSCPRVSLQAFTPNEENLGPGSAASLAPPPGSMYEAVIVLRWGFHALLLYKLYFSRNVDDHTGD